jgi:23S rRNA pseudouridine1911/1915/1917 synthase
MFVFVQSKMREPVSAILTRALAGDSSRAEALIAIGAVYLEARRLKADTQAAIGNWVSFHPRPRHFPVEHYRWHPRIVFEDEDYLVVNKPAGIPVPPTRDNYYENLTIQVGLAINHELKPVHRLDLPTRGLVCLAKHPRAAAFLQKAFATRIVKKRYRALVEKPLATGRVVHHWNPVTRELSDRPRRGWKRCELEIEEVTRRGKIYEVKINLLTGRTHQIRAQLAAGGAPILGDRRYGSPVQRELGLEAYELTLPAGLTKPGLTTWNISVPASRKLL